MTYELLCYLCLSLTGLIFCFVKIKNSHVYNVFTFSVFFIFSIVTRYSGFDIDMNTYEAALRSDLFSLYYVKEPMYWITSRYVYDIVGTPEVTFIFYDIISFFLILKARHNFRFPQYFPYLFLLFFPAVMGMNNVYRQYLAYAIFVYLSSLFVISSSGLKRGVVMFFAILTHNVSALYSPLFYMINKKDRISFRALLLCILVIIALPFALDSKSNSETGSTSVIIYLFSIGAIIFFYLLSYRFSFRSTAAKFFYFLIYTIFLTSVSAAIMGSAQSKRVGMFSLMISLIPTVFAIEKNYKQRVLVRALVYVLLLLPTLLFSSSLNMLLTINYPS